MAPPFGPIVDLGRVMRGYPHQWFVSGGWAIDLFAGRVTREHEDIELGAYLPHQQALRRHLAGWRLSRIRNDAVEPWNPDDTIVLPDFQARVRSDQIEPRLFDIFFNRLDGDDWVSRRHPDLRVPAIEVFRRTVAQGELPPDIPYLVPEIQLLYKAKYHRPKDEADFDAVAENMALPQRRWLRDALLVNHAGDPWIERL